MWLSLFIARRYLFAKKKQNAINIISTISVVGVTIGTTALIVVLSIFNGMDVLLQKSTDSFSPDLVISPKTGKFVDFDSSVYSILDQNAEIDFYNKVIEEKAMVKYGETILPIVLKGVDSTYVKNSRLADGIVDGKLLLKTDSGYGAAVGYGIAAQLRIGLTLLTPMVFYYPDKNATSTLNALNSKYLFPTGLFAVQQEIDVQYVITDIDFAKDLFKTGTMISKIEIKINDSSLLSKVKEQLAKDTQGQFRIEDKFEMNKAFYAMMKSEKLAVFMILLFILLIALFNIVGSISMLIIDKKEDINTYKAMGMTTERIISIFKTEGNLITFIGTLLGVVIGVTICFIQEKYGVITLGDGSYIIDAYPVKLVLNDILIIIVTILSMGYLASWLPVTYLVKKLGK